jgi:hypothetical protein
MKEKASNLGEDNRVATSVGLRALGCGLVIDREARGLTTLNKMDHGLFSQWFWGKHAEPMRGLGLLLKNGGWYADTDMSEDRYFYAGGFVCWALRRPMHEGARPSPGRSNLDNSKRDRLGDRLHLGEAVELVAGGVKIEQHDKIAVDIRELREHAVARRRAACMTCPEMARRASEFHEADL